MTNTTNPRVNPFEYGQAVARVQLEVGGLPPKGHEVGAVTYVTGIVGHDAIRVADDGQSVWSVDWFEAVTTEDVLRARDARELERYEAGVREGRREVADDLAVKRASVSDLLAIIDRQTDSLAALENERDTVASVLDYAIGLLNVKKQHRVFGFWDALNDTDELDSLT